MDSSGFHACPWIGTTVYLPVDTKLVDGTPYWLHRDHQRSVRAVSDAAGAPAGVPVQRQVYFPYGERLATATAFEESKGYIGERQDAETGLFYLHARYYDPVLARFVTADPSPDPLAPGVGLNRYAYAGNNPVNFVDRNGRYLELPFEVASIGFGIFSFANNLAEGNFFEAAIDAGGVALDIGGMLAPGVPGVAGLSIKASREATEAAIDAGRVAGKVKKGGVGPVNQGKAGTRESEKRAAAKGETILGNEVTLELKSGKRTRVDTATESPDGTFNFVESKNGPNASLTPNQRELKEACCRGETVTPRGNRAREAGFLPGKPIRGNFREDRFDPAID